LDCKMQFAPHKEHLRKVETLEPEGQKDYSRQRKAQERHKGDGRRTHRA